MSINEMYCDVVDCNRPVTLVHARGLGGCGHKLCIEHENGRCRACLGTIVETYSAGYVNFHTTLYRPVGSKEFMRVWEATPALKRFSSAQFFPQMNLFSWDEKIWLVLQPNVEAYLTTHKSQDNALPLE